jgi:hypothetical protein
MTTITHNTDRSITVSTTLHLAENIMKMENMIWMQHQLSF